MGWLAWSRHTERIAMRTISNSGLSLLIACLTTCFVAGPARAGAALKICNEGTVPLHYGMLQEVWSANVEDVETYRLIWYRTVKPESCKRVHEGYFRNTFFFMVVDPETGIAYNATYVPRSARSDDSHVKRVCVPRNMSSFNEVFRASIIEKFKERCPKFWVPVATSFTTSFSPGFGGGSSVLTLRVTPDPGDLSMRRMWQE